MKGAGVTHAPCLYFFQLPYIYDGLWGVYSEELNCVVTWVLVPSSVQTLTC